MITDGGIFLSNYIISYCAVYMYYIDNRSNNVYVVALTFIPMLNNIQETFLLMRDKCKIINVEQNAKRL